MKLGIFYCIAFSFLAVIIFYIAYKFPEYLRNERSKKYFQDHNIFPVVNQRNSESDRSKQIPTNDVREITNQTYKNLTVSKTINDLVPLEEAIRNEERKQADGKYFDGRLVRKRRFLIFPEGSSLQVVFCLTYFTVIPIADIFYMGATASLAWELPQNPYSPFEHHADALHRKDEGPVVYEDVKGSQKMNDWGNRILVNKYTGQAFQPFSKDYYSKKYEGYKKATDNEKKQFARKGKQKKVKINPVFAKRSVANDETDKAGKSKPHSKRKRASVRPADIEAMHREQEIRKHLKQEYMDKNVIDFHRTSRYGLYEKVEKLLIGMGTHGKECVLKALCEIGQDLNGKQGTFLEEILRVIFTLPKGSRYHAKYVHYDDAHAATYKCADVYPKCSFSIKSFPML